MPVPGPGGIIREKGDRADRSIPRFELRKARHHDRQARCRIGRASSVAPVRARPVRRCWFGHRRCGDRSRGVPRRRQGAASPSPVRRNTQEESIMTDATPTAAAPSTVVLVHGAFADASGWNGVIERLQAAGVAVAAPPNPLRGISHDAAYIASFLNQIPGPVLARRPLLRRRGHHQRRPPRPRTSSAWSTSPPSPRTRAKPCWRSRTTPGTAS